MKNGFKDLIVWQKAYHLSLLVYRVTGNFPKEERYGLVNQMRSCAVSAPANISEGYERTGQKEFLYFLRIAKGSLGELETYLQLAKDLGFLAGKQWDELNELRCSVMQLLRGLMRSLSGTTTLRHYGTTNPSTTKPDKNVVQ